jgi:hypothetical protein
MVLRCYLIGLLPPTSGCIIWLFFSCLNARSTHACRSARAVGRGGLGPPVQVGKAAGLDWQSCATSCLHGFPNPAGTRCQWPRAAPAEERISPYFPRTLMGSIRPGPKGRNSRGQGEALGTEAPHPIVGHPLPRCGRGQARKFRSHPSPGGEGGEPSEPGEGGRICTPTVRTGDGETATTPVRGRGPNSHTRRVAVGCVIAPHQGRKYFGNCGGVPWALSVCGGLLALFPFGGPGGGVTTLA